MNSFITFLLVKLHLSTTAMGSYSLWQVLERQTCLALENTDCEDSGNYAKYEIIAKIGNVLSQEGKA